MLFTFHLWFVSYCTVSRLPQSIRYIEISEYCLYYMGKYRYRYKIELRMEDRANNIKAIQYHHVCKDMIDWLGGGSFVRIWDQIQSNLSVT